MEVVIPGVSESDGEVFKVAPSGEYEAQICSSEIAVTGPNSKFPGTPMLKLTIKLEDDEYPVNVFHNMVLPVGDYLNSLNAEQLRRRRAELKQLQIACGIDGTDTIDSDDYMECSVRVVILKYDDPERGPQNRIKEFLSA